MRQFISIIRLVLLELKLCTRVEELLKGATQILIKSGPRVIIRAWEIESKGGALRKKKHLADQQEASHTPLRQGGASNAHLWWAGRLPAHTWNAWGNQAIVSIKLRYKYIVSLSSALELRTRGISRDLCQRSRSHRGSSESIRDIQWEGDAFSWLTQTWMLDSILLSWLHSCKNTK